MCVYTYIYIYIYIYIHMYIHILISHYISIVYYNIMFYSVSSNSTVGGGGGPTWPAAFEPAEVDWPHQGFFQPHGLACLPEASFVLIHISIKVRSIRFICSL